MSSLYLLGIDTGGTYTDAVIFREPEGVIAKAKSLTTRHDLSKGIAGAVEKVLATSGIAPSDIAMVSLSTTLATNALVEGQGGRIALVMIGFSEEDLARGGLADALGQDPVVHVPGGHDVHGNEMALDMGAVDEAAKAFGDNVSAFAVAGYFAVRNPAHELRVRERLREKTALPITCSHELSSKLGGPRRALTTLLNSRLVPVIDRLIDACQGFLASIGVDAPLMVVRGDGALISAAEARLRPIETILSGPAASLVGARYLTGLDRAVVSDIGGTTTDVAVLDDGMPRLAEEGAIVGGHRTMVEAVALRTFGLGGDSEVHIDDRGLTPAIALGPRRILPLSLLAARYADVVVSVLEKQLRSVRPGRHDGRFAISTGLPRNLVHGLKPQDEALLQRVGPVPAPLDDLLQATAQKAVLDKLVTHGLVHIGGITPSDALHVLGRQDQWNAQAARLGFELEARRKDGSGRTMAGSAEALAEMVVAQLTRYSAEAILTTCLGEDGGETIDPSGSPVVDRALRRHPGIARFSVSLDRPLVGLGASASIYYPAVADMLGADPVIPDHADVANAIGAVVGQVRSVVVVVVTSLGEGRYLVSGGADNLVVVGDEHDALTAARERARTKALEHAARDGASNALVTMAEEVDRPEVEGFARLLEARIIATAVGRPRTTSL
ncbi:hydantoinase/oxoprolinase family protein [Neorhizobium sp. T786]|uniref:hydantoinase/oxoprolinase family protein n=1 Tax=Pseudorhizobium xiangyangii TaxID=2883104 RepID=UPI001CFF7B6F|nr:hydantoinase/oxoprolinase family protein [Neorhizobium xiangyangii]MCB5205340.1 hydantoinase/oxoprolinase family protein [Neorhizobium xiangyangii]